MSTLVKLAKNILPTQAYSRLKFIYRELKISIARRKYYGDNNYCPVCQSNLNKFLAGGTDNRPDALCPVCGCYDRHRFAFYFFTSMTNLFNSDRKTFLHIAPERGIALRLRREPHIYYVRADLFLSDVDVKADVIQPPFKDNSFDVFFISHVLEHIERDVAAISELYRILKPGGWGLVQVPVMAEKTFEDKNITTPEQKAKAYGQDDHERICGRDYGERFMAAGFSCKIITPGEITDQKIIRLSGLDENEISFLLKK